MTEGSGGTIKVSERIAPEITASLFANYRSSADAVMELLDNAVDSRLPGFPLRVRLTVHPASLVVHAEGGEGMGVRELEHNYLRWGASPKRGRHNLLGQYGQGGKAAIGHLGRRFTVEASRPGVPIAWRFADPDYRDRRRLKTYEVTEVAKRTSADTGYVRIRIDEVDKRIDQRRLSQRLAETYRPLLEERSLEIFLNDSQILPSPIWVDERKPFTANAASGRLRGWTGVASADRGSPGWIPGLRIYKLGRLITEGEFFGHPSAAQHPGLSRLMGEVEIPRVPLTMNKSDFDRDSAQWVEVEERMHRLLAPLVRRLARDGEAPPPESALRAAEQVRRLLSQALRLADRTDLFAGLSGNAAREERSARAEPELPLVAPLEPPQPSPPKVPLPRPKGQRRGFGNIVIRALHPRVRSTTVLEEGVRGIVINSEYPLFKERRGDFWYQLETAARELCKLAEPNSVPEYESRVNELLLTAATLRTRRRRPRGGTQLALLR